MNQVHDGEHEAAMDTQKKITQFANGLEDRNYGNKIINAAKAIAAGEYPPQGADIHYPVQPEDSERMIHNASSLSLNRKLLNFRNKWGITDVVTSAAMLEMFSHHRYGKQDLDDNGQIRDILTEGSKVYKQMALDPEVQQLSPRVKYRSKLREAITELADKMIEEI